MSSPHDRNHEELFDLLAEQVASGLDTQDQTRLDALLIESTDAEVDGFETAAAAVACALSGADAEPMPAHLRDRCLGAARALRSDEDEGRPPVPVSGNGPLRFTAQTPTRPQSSSIARLGWLAAAACLVFAVASWWPSQGTGSQGYSADRAALIASAPDLSQWQWGAWDESYEGVTGDVVWSESAQEGYMVISGLEPNDPSTEQYQLWIVESSRGTPLEVPPVDGGVFDVSDAGELIIPIRAKLGSHDVVAFAITREVPGGVVVSDRERKVIIATAPSEG